MRIDSIKYKLICMVSLVLLCTLALGAVSFLGIQRQGALFRDVAGEVPGVMARIEGLNRKLKETIENSDNMGKMVAQLGNEFKGAQQLIHDSGMFSSRQRRESMAALADTALQLLDGRIASAKFLADASVKSEDVRKSAAGFYSACLEDVGVKEDLDFSVSVDPYEDQGVLTDFVGALVSSANANFYVVLGLSGAYRAKGLHSNEEDLFDADFHNSHLFNAAIRENRIAKGIDRIDGNLVIGSAAFLKSISGRDVGILICGYRFDQSMLRFLSDDLNASLALFMAEGMGRARYSTLVDENNDVLKDIRLPPGLMEDFNKRLSVIRQEALRAGNLIDGRFIQRDFVVVREIEAGGLNYVMAYQALFTDDGSLLGVLGIARDITKSITQQKEIDEKAALAIRKAKEIEISSENLTRLSDVSRKEALVLIDSVNSVKMQLNQTLESMGVVASRAEYATMIFFMVTLVIGMVIVFMVDRIIVKPLNKVVHFIQRVSDGDLSEPFDVHTAVLNRKDEVGILANALIKMGDNLSGTVRVAERVAAGDLSVRVNVLSEKDMLGRSLSAMTENLQKMTKESQREDWLKTGQNELNERMRGEQDLVPLTENILSYLADYLKVQVGVCYLVEYEDKLRLVSSYAYKLRNNNFNEFRFGEGLIGQAALEKKSILFTGVPEDHVPMAIISGMGVSVPRNIFVLPLIFEARVLGVLAFGTSGDFDGIKIKLLERVSENIAVNLNSAGSRVRMRELLEETRAQSDKLGMQQEELQANNEELEEKTEMLENQKAEIEKKNRVLQESQWEIEEKARQLELVSKYKSEFLSNMSHELRTPLNSLLILAKVLSENEENNLTLDQIESAASILRSGRTLLNLINDILDLSKIEAKKIELHCARLNLNTFVTNFKNEFKHMAEKKGIEFKVSVESEAPEYIITDAQRLEQIIRNLVGNAFKFTDSGFVLLRIVRPDNSVEPVRKDLDLNRSIAISVADSGPGIPEARLNQIFEAFKQIDASITRRYGGTGLGLSISKELAQLIGGELRVQSTLGKGSVFTLYIPESISPAPAEEVGPVSAVKKSEVEKKEPVENTEASVNAVTVHATEIIGYPAQKTMLIIEDDAEFAGILADFFKKSGYDSVIAPDGETGIKYVIEHNPTAVILDIGLPGIDGWVVLNELKTNPETRHIPVHIISGYDNISEGLQRGAVGILAKPVTTEDLTKALRRIESVLDSEVKELLVVEDDEALRKSILNLMGTNDIKATATGSGEEALDILKRKRFDCIILDLGLPDISGFELLDRIKRSEVFENTPIIIYTGRDLTKTETEKLEKYSSSIVLKSAVSLDRLLDETALFMHRVEKKLPENQQAMIRRVRDNESVLAGKTVLIVDDDMRNAFAISRFLKGRDMMTAIAENGRKALELLEAGKTPDIILMDIMMPVMDGYETIKRIRMLESFETIPILALTAKAMESDREACIKSGASDYLSKPVDVTKLLSMLRVWLY